ncbi:MAG TPA: VOC family protein [Opitutus sp.]|nr:VOC family protein [Opitutus sp.]
MKASLQLRTIHLRVSDLERSVAFYSNQLGLHVIHRESQRASLATASDGPELLFLTEDRAARPAPRDAAGLFHAALLFPSRSALGSWLRVAADAGVKFDGFSDHGVSEAIYFTDPDGNGLEFYTDWPRERWPFHHGELQMVTEPLALPELLAAGAAHEGSPLAGSQWGHLHLRVSSLDQSQEFYASTLGLSLMQRFGDSARFLAADGYHHHIGLNCWGGIRQPQPGNSLGLIEAAFERSGTTADVVLQDPDNIRVRVIPG